MASNRFRFTTVSRFLACGMLLASPLAAQQPEREVEVERRIERRVEPGPEGPGFLGRGPGQMRDRMGPMRQRAARRGAPGGMQPGMPGQIPPDVAKEAGITDEQLRKMQDIRFNVEKARIQGEADLRVKQLELRRLVEADTPDRAAIDKKVTEVAQAQAALMRANLNGELDGRAVITREQREKVQEIMRRRAEQQRERRVERPAPAPRPEAPMPPRPPRRDVP